MSTSPFSDLRPTALTRREFLLFGAAGVATAALLPDLAHAAGATRWGAPDPVRLTARPGTPHGVLERGLHPLGFDSPRDALLYVPESYTATKPATLIVALHGATQGASVMTTRLGPMADATGAVILAPDSRGRTWDAIRGDFGADPVFIDRALRWVFYRCAVDPSRVILGGFSDGATYALSFGLANGDLFSRVIAFSPGFVIPVQRHGKPEIFVSHGRQDPILPIDQASRLIVPELKRAGYSVRFEEFDGGHRVAEV